MNGRALVTPSLALAAILNVFNNDWIYSSLFFYTHPAWKIYATLLIPLVVVFVVAFVATKIVGEKTTIQIVDVVTFVFLALLIYNIGKRNGLFAGNLSLVFKALLVTTVLVLSFLGSHFLSAELLGRLRVAVMAGCVFFLFAPEIVSPIETSENIAIAPFFHAASGALKTNVVVLILDELSFLEPSPIDAALKAGNHRVYSKAVTSSGKRTDSSIPSLFTGVDMDGARACSPTALCSSAGLFDFAKQTVARPGINIVGFYHPYCAMKGLTYCRQIPVFGNASIIIGYGCNLIAQFAATKRPAFCERQWLDSVRAVNARQRIHNAVYNAPFWKEGGILYVHTLLPHPPGAVNGGTLDEDYAANLHQAAKLSADLAGKLDNAFGGNYLLIITSDHPLRPEVWCAMYRYQQAGCLANSQRFTATHVPLIAIGQGAESVMTLQSNFDFFKQLATD